MSSFTFAEENYLKAIYHLSATGLPMVGTSSIAEKLNTRPASVSDMIKKLSDKEVVTYVKYQGVTITAKGRKEALRVIRKHRLWEAFLVNKLGFRWDEVHEVAEQLEHIKSPLLISRLDEFLGFPKFDPHGDPIPDKEGRIASKPQLKLSELKVGDEAEVVSMKDTGISFLKYLDHIHLKIGSSIRVLEIMEFDGSRQIATNNHQSIAISQQVSSNLLVLRK
jgi:DtxR family Mn-dependent transcriptional regulator